MGEKKRAKPSFALQGTIKGIQLKSKNIKCLICIYLIIFRIIQKSKSSPGKNRTCI